MTLDLVDWHDVVPKAGLPENVILDQLSPATWDIFIGVLWHRFGTPTGVSNRSTDMEYLSGTEQEFHLAYQLWERYHRPRVSFYFSLRKLKHLHDIDPKQFELVKNFIAQFAPKGATPGLYQTFKNIRSFEELVRKNLTDFLLQRSARSKMKKAGHSRVSKVSKLNKGASDILGSLLMRGVKESYYRKLDSNMRVCPAVRLNVMVPNRRNDALEIRFVDDRVNYTPAELAKTWSRGEGKCGAAWEENDQQIYASDSNTPERFLEPMDASATAKLIDLQSVISTPIRHAGEIVGILNLDSKHDSRITKIQDTNIRTLLSELAAQFGYFISTC